MKHIALTFSEFREVILSAMKLGQAGLAGDPDFAAEYSDAWDVDVPYQPYSRPYAMGGWPSGSLHDIVAILCEWVDVTAPHQLGGYTKAEHAGGYYRLRLHASQLSGHEIVAASKRLDETLRKIGVEENRISSLLALR